LKIFKFIINKHRSKLAKANAGISLFTPVPVVPLSDQYCGIYCRFSRVKSVQLGGFLNFLEILSFEIKNKGK